MWKAMGCGSVGWEVSPKYLLLLREMHSTGFKRSILDQCSLIHCRS